MCGIVGMAGGGIATKDLDIFELLMQISTIRGQDGTGIFQARFEENRKKTWLIEKMPTEVNDFFRKCSNPLLLKSVMDNVFIGHVRAATRGVRNEANTHPFHIKDIVGVHNGTLYDKKYDDKLIVDSKLLYEDIAARGAKKVLAELNPNSAYALVWFDMTTNKINFACNGKRPLWICNNQERRVMYWASESGMLRYILNREGVKFHPLCYFEPGKIYSIDPQEITIQELSFGIEKFKLPVAAPVVDKKKKKGKWTRADVEYWNSIFDKQTALTGLDDDIPFDSKDKTLALPQTSVPIIPKVENKQIIRRSTKIPHVNCLTCTKPMSLYDQYKSIKVTIDDVVHYECPQCTEIAVAESAKLDQQIKDAAAWRRSLN